MGFAASIAVKKFGLEAYNKITWVTEDTKGIFRRYPKAKKNYKAAKSTDGKVVEDHADAEDAEDDYDDDVDVNEKDEARMLVFEKEEQKHTKPKVIAKNQQFVRDLLHKAATLISNEGVIIVLHHTGSPYSEWKLDEIDVEHRLEKLEDSKSLDLKLYPHLKGSDLKLTRIPSAFHCYRKKKK
nr:hypothetical protein [Tanacetum cinerariifolium]